MTTKKINTVELENKWKNEWERAKVYSPDLKSAAKPFYNLMMFPYPSAEGLHVGNMYAFSGTDIYGRFKRMQGMDVFEPIGLDGFGIHSENYAIKVGRHPKKHAKISEEHFYEQLSKIGNGFAWDNRLETYDPDYYRWTQWLFIQMFKAGLAYKDSAVVNWCPSDKTVLSDEQVEEGKCERCKTEVERKEMSSWFFKITEYSERLLNNLDKIDWPDRIKIAQRQWIGKKEGAEVVYPIENSDKEITCFTTRPETNFGATFIVVAPEYAKGLLDIMPEEKKVSVSEYINISLSKSEQDRKIDEKEKTGVFTGLYAINRLNGCKMPVWVADYVLMGFGTGAVVGVPAHDERDLEFAEKHKLEIIKVIDSDKIINSQFLNGLTVDEAFEKIIVYLEDKEWGKRKTNYHLRDWGISRQRYWGAPIPMAYCDKCGWQPVNENELPVLLPDIDDFKPKGDGTSPLSNAQDDWKNTKCTKCGENAKRELDVCDTFLDSSWYFLRYPFVNDNNRQPWDWELTKKWFPVNTYIGGAEHAVLHLLYARFVWMALMDQKLLPEELGDEPFPFLFGHGLIIKDGSKMSKSKGNVINPDEYIEKYGADAFRLYLMFLGPYDGGGDFRDSGIEGMGRFVNKVWELSNLQINLDEKNARKLQVKLHKTIQKVTDDISEFKYNTAISAMMELTNLMKELKDKASSEDNGSNDAWSEAIRTLTLILAPFAPFITEEIWVNILNRDFSIHKQTWPEFNESLTLDEVVNIAIQVNGRFRANVQVNVEISADEEKVVELATNEDNVKKYITGEIKKKIFVPGKILNLVV